MTRSMYIAPFPKAALASLEADSKAAAKSSAFSTFRIPLPPPPAEALSMTG